MITICSTLTATLVRSMGDDQAVVDAARVSVGSDSDQLGEKDLGLIKFLARNRHTSPFEHVTATFLIDAPIFVAREWHRHRTQSYNEVSGRYRELEGRFYVPSADRSLIQQGKPGAYSFVPGSFNQHELVRNCLEATYERAWSQYQIMLQNGIAKEVARMGLPVSTYTQWYATANLLNWIRFLGLRTHETAMREIRTLALQVEESLLKLAPHSMEAFAEQGL